MQGRRLAVCLALAPALAARVLVAADGTPERLIRYTQNSLTVRLTRVPLAGVLIEIARQAGAEIREEQLRDLGDVSAEFEAMPLPTALGRLLGERSFALIYGPGGQLRTIRVLGVSQAADTAAGALGARVPPSPSLPAAAPPNPAARWAEAVARHPPVPISGRVARALGCQSASFRDLMNAAMRNEDPSVRSAAFRAGLRALATDSEMRGALLDLWNNISDADLAKVVGALAGDNADEVLSRLAAESPTRALRRKATAALDQLRLQAWQAGRPSG